MPDADGWHSNAFLGKDGHLYRWHYCQGATRDALVRDTPEEREKHQHKCTARVAAQARMRREQAEERRREALALARQQKAESG